MLLRQFLRQLGALPEQDSPHKNAMEPFLIDHGLPALFVLSFLAATLLPLGSEWLLLTLVLKGQSVTPLVLVATIGNVLGAIVTYSIGRWGAEFLQKKVLRLDDRQAERATQLYTRYGPVSLLFAWLPIVGDPLCLAAGLLNLSPLRFLLPVTIGKLGRYLFIALLSSPRP